MVQPRLEVTNIQKIYLDEILRKDVHSTVLFFSWFLIICSIQLLPVKFIFSQTSIQHNYKED